MSFHQFQSPIRNPLKSRSFNLFKNLEFELYMSIHIYFENFMKLGNGNHLKLEMEVLCDAGDVEAGRDAGAAGGDGDDGAIGG